MRSNLIPLALFPFLALAACPSATILVDPTPVSPSDLPSDPPTEPVTDEPTPATTPNNGLPPGPVTGLNTPPITPPAPSAPNPTPEALPSPAALDVDGPTLAELSWFQVVEIPALASTGDIEPDDRVAPLIVGRPAVLRAHIDVPTGWTAGEVELRVDLLSGGFHHIHTTTRTLAAATDVGDPSGGVTIEIPAEQVTQDATYRVSISRTQQADASDVFPDSEAAALAPVETGPLRVYLVPYELNGFVPETSANVLERYRDELLAMYPTNEVIFELGAVRQPESSDIGDILVEVGQLIDQDIGPGPQYFYYGMATGTADRDSFQGITGSSQELTARGGFAIGAAFPDDRAASTFAHELGHLHFLRHAPCGNPDNLDDDFPYEGGTIGVDGYDVRTGTFVEATHVDVMSYCSPRWISDYHYAELVSWTVEMQTF